MPRVSVCIPTYNSARFLGDAIESALGQTFADFELVVCDNASDDETSALCGGYSDPRLKYHRFQELVGQGGNWNRCLQLASGEFVALLHADDVYLPDFLGERVRQFEASPESGLGFGAVELIDEKGLLVGRRSFSDREIVAPSSQFYGELLMGCIINPASVVVRRSCYSRVGPFNEQHLWAIDWEMWLRLAAIAGVSYSPKISSRYRIHGASGSATGLLGPRYLSDDLAVLKSALDRLDDDPKLDASRPRRREALRAYSLRAMAAAGTSCEAGERLSTLRSLGTALRHSPALVTRPTVWALAAGAFVGPWSYRLWKRLRSRGATA